MHFSRPTWTASAASALALSLAACGGSSDDKSSPKPTPTPTSTYSAEIRRTEFGVPHIVAADEKGIGYGVGYAYAEDNVCLMADLLVTLRGERAKFFGGSASYDSGFGHTVNNLNSDFIHKLVNDDAQVQASWARQGQEVKDLMQGYAAGYNRYLKDVGVAQLPQACKGQAWVRDMTTADLMRLYRFFAVSPELMADIAEHVSDGGDTPKGLSNARPDPIRARIRMGSNGVALGKDATESGKGLLLANPHFPWNGPGRFYQVHLTIPGKVDVMGASLAGFPAVNIGFNKELAWTHTVTSSLHNTAYRLSLDPAKPGHYLIDKQSKPLDKRTVSVEVLTGGVLSTVKRDFYSSEFGPVLQSDATHAMTLRDANVDNDRMLAQWWAMNRAASLDEFKASIERIMGIPWVQTIAVDKGGRAYYGNVTPVPALSPAKLKACAVMPTTEPGQSPVLDGSSSACAWDVDPSTPQKGIVPAQQLPSLVRTDFVQNSNDSAWMSNPAQPLVGFGPLVSEEGKPLSGRTRYGLSEIAARLKGSGARFNVQNLQAMSFSNQSYSASHALADLRTACEGLSEVTLMETGTKVNVSKACQVLKTWDGKAEVDSIGWPVFEASLGIMNASGADVARQAFDAKDPVNTPRGLRVSDPAVMQSVRQALAQAVLTLEAAGIDYSKPWGQIQQAVRGSKRIPIHGGNVFVEDIYNAMASLPSKTQPGLLEPYAGSSIVLTVSFEGDSPQAQGFLTYSQSTNPDSPHYADQTERFSKKQWISYPFTDAAIKADPKYSSKLIKE